MAFGANFTSCWIQGTNLMRIHAIRIRIRNTGNRYKKRLGKVPLPYLFQVESGEPEKNVVGKKEGTVSEPLAVENAQQLRNPSNTGI